MNKAETPRWIQDKHFNEVLFCEDFLAAYPMVCVSGSFFTVDGRITDEESIRKQIYECSARISAAVLQNAPPVCWKC